MNGINKCCVVPVLDDIVWPIMDLNFDGVTTIVDEEYDGVLPATKHG